MRITLGGALEYKMDGSPRRSKNSYLREAVTMQAQFLQTIYDLADCEDLSQEEQNKVLEIAANTKDALPILEGMMGQEDKKSKKTSEKEPEEKGEDGDDDFVKSLLDGLPKNAKVVKIVKGAKA